MSGRRLAAFAAALALQATSTTSQALPAGSAGAAVGVSGLDSAQATDRTASWSGGVRAELLVTELGPVRLRGELASLHFSADGSTEAIEVDTGYHAAMLMGSVGLRAGSLEPYLAAGPVAWLITTDIRVDETQESFSDTALGFGGLAGLRAAEGPLVPRIEAGVAARAGRTAVFAAVGLSWAWDPS